MLKQETIGHSRFPHEQYWPPVNAANEFSLTLNELLALNMGELTDKLQEIISATHNEELVNKYLAEIYSLYYGYKDAPRIDFWEKPETFSRIEFIKLTLEDFFINTLLKSRYELPEISCAAQVGDYLRFFVEHNYGVSHAFFDFVADEMSEQQMKEFLLLEVIRNEIVDDEVALMVPGLQYSMKQVVVSNLWDECGNGAIDNFHTNWLRRLLTAHDEWSNILTYRAEQKPWVASISSNSFNAVLTTRFKCHRAYGHFMTTEAWVAPHFKKILQGMDRLGITDQNVRVYFDAHMRIDPHHAEEMIEGLLKNTPELAQVVLYDIIKGAHQAAMAGEMMYDKLLEYFRGNGH